MAQTYEMNLIKLLDEFDSDGDCRTYLERLRWPNGVACPECGDMSISRITTRNQYDCNSCRNRFSVTSGTIMHDSKLPLKKWILAIYMVVEAKKSISSRQLGRTIGVTSKTAWFLTQRIREALRTPDALLSGIIEVDETYIGGKTVLKVAPNNSKKTLHGFADKHVSDEAEAIYTDEWQAYRGIGDENTRHETVNHHQDEWVRGDVHTNTVEGVWALFKRGVVGSFHQISKKHLDRYLDEFEFRFSNRDNPFIFRDALKELVHAKRLQYSELVAN